MSNTWASEPYDGPLLTVWWIKGKSEWPLTITYIYDKVEEDKKAIRKQIGKILNERR